MANYTTNEIMNKLTMCQDKYTSIMDNVYLKSSQLFDEARRIWFFDEAKRSWFFAEAKRIWFFDEAKRIWFFNEAKRIWFFNEAKFLKKLNFLSILEVVLLCTTFVMFILWRLVCRRERLLKINFKNQNKMHCDMVCSLEDTNKTLTIHLEEERTKTLDGWTLEEWAEWTSEQNKLYLWEDYDDADDDDDDELIEEAYRKYEDEELDEELVEEAYRKYQAKHAEPRDEEDTTLCEEDDKTLIPHPTKKCKRTNFKKMTERGGHKRLLLTLHRYLDALGMKDTEIKLHGWFVVLKKRKYGNHSPDIYYNGPNGEKCISRPAVARLFGFDV